MNASYVKVIAIRNTIDLTVCHKNSEIRTIFDITIIIHFFEKSDIQIDQLIRIKFSNLFL